MLGLAHHVEHADDLVAVRERVVEDITQRRLVHEERDRMEVELRFAQKLEAVGQLAAGIAHEVNTPIQFVGDSVEFLRSGFEDLLDVVREYGRAFDELGETVPPEIRERIARAGADADVEYLNERAPVALERTLDGDARVAKIVRAMKEFAHPATADMAPADLNSALENTLVVAANEIEYVANVVLELGQLPPVQCHASDVNQVFLNLVVNASHAMSDVLADGELGTLTLRSRQEGNGP